MKFERMKMSKKPVLGRDGGSTFHVGSMDLEEDGDVRAEGLADELALGDLNRDREE